MQHSPLIRPQAQPFLARAMSAVALQLSVAALIGGSLLAVAGPAAAAGCQGAPGASAIQQYCEAVPNASGQRQSPGGPSSGSAGSPGGHPVSASTAAALARSGSSGAAILRFSGDGGGAHSSGGARHGKTTHVSGKSGTTGTQIAGPRDPGDSPVSGAVNAVSSGPTAKSGVLWGLLGISAAGAAGAVFVRRKKLKYDDDRDE